MRSGQWFLKGIFHITHKSRLEKYMDRDTMVYIPLHVTSSKEAEKEARKILKRFKKAVSEKDIEYFQQYCSICKTEEGVWFGDFRIFFEKNLKIQIPPIDVAEKWSKNKED